MCIVYHRKPRGTKYIVEGEVRVGPADHHDYILPRSLVCIISVIGTFLLVAGAILLLIGTSTSSGILMPWGAVICGIGFLLCFISLLLCLHAYCIIPVGGYKVPSQPAKKVSFQNVVLVQRIDSREDERFANKRVFSDGGVAGESGTLTSTHGRTGHISNASGYQDGVQNSHAQNVAYQSGGYATMESTGGTMARQESGQGGTIQRQASSSMSSAATNVESSSTARAVTVVDGRNNLLVADSNQGVMRGVAKSDTIPPPAGAKQAVYVQVQTQPPSTGHQAQRLQSHSQKVEYAQIQAQGQGSHSPVPQRNETMVVTNVQQQYSSPQHTAGADVGVRAQTIGHGASTGQQQYSYSSQVHSEAVSGGQLHAAASPHGVAISPVGHHYATISGQPNASDQQTMYYSETTQQYSTMDGGRHEQTNAMPGLVIPAHFHGEATPDMRYTRRDMSNMSNASNISGFSRPDSFGAERDDDFEYYPGGGESQQKQQSNQSYNYNYQYSVETPQVQTQSQTSTVTYSAPRAQYMDARKGSIYENTQL